MRQKLRKTLSTLTFLGAFITAAYAAGMTTISDKPQSGVPDGWITDYKAALAQAKAENKDVFIDFTGSDWCGWCKKLHREVLDSPEFIEYAKQHLVLVYLDFPRSKEQSTSLKAQNDTLAKKYGIRGFPTIIILNSDGQQIGQMGYMKGGPKAFIPALEKVTGKQ